MSNLKNKDLVGPAFEEMTIEEMSASQGSGDLQGDSITLTPFLPLTVPTNIAFSKVLC